MMVMEIERSSTQVHYIKDISLFLHVYVAIIISTNAVEHKGVYMGNLQQTTLQ